MGVIFASSPSLLQPCWEGSVYVISWPQQSRNISVLSHSHGNSFLGFFNLFYFHLSSLRLLLLQRVTGCIYKRQYLAQCTEEHKETLNCARNQYIYTRFHFWWFQAVHQAKAVFSTLYMSIYNQHVHPTSKCMWTYSCVPTIYCLPGITPLWVQNRCRLYTSNKSINCPALHADMVYFYFFCLNWTEHKQRKEFIINNQKWESFFTHKCVKSQKAKRRWESGALESLQAVLCVSHISLSCPLCHESLSVSACKNATV